MDMGYYSSFINQNDVLASRTAPESSPMYHVYSDKKGISETQRAPKSYPLISSFIASLERSYSGATISNYVNGIRAWHIIHGMEWKLNELETETLLKGAERLTQTEKEATVHPRIHRKYPAPTQPRKLIRCSSVRMSHHLLLRGSAHWRTDSPMS
jgi:hypothetical protein